jgi:sarcosine oxidase subunit alpha
VATRITKNIERETRLSLNINGDHVSAYAGETIASVLFAENINIFYKTRSNKPRAPFCNMGTCFECQVKVKRVNKKGASTWVRACMTLVEDGMKVTSGDKIHSLESFCVKD